jgi:DNA-binding CsgD family transcriptional regulator
MKGLPPYVWYLLHKLLIRIGNTDSLTEADKLLSLGLEEINREILPHYSNLTDSIIRENINPLTEVIFMHIRNHELLKLREIKAVELSDNCQLLSRREAQIAALISSGERPAAISSFLGIRRTTVERHIANIYSKINISNRNQLREVFHALPAGSSLDQNK